MSFVYDHARFLQQEGLLDLREAGGDIRIALLKVAGSTTCDTEKDKATISGFTTLGELVATNYVRKALANQVVTEDNINNRSEFNADPVIWSALGGAVNDTIGAMLIYKHVTNDADSIPIAYIDSATGSPGLPLTTNGGDVTMTPNAEGLIQN